MNDTRIQTKRRSLKFFPLGWIIFFLFFYTLTHAQKVICLRENVKTGFAIRPFSEKEKMPLVMRVMAFDVANQRIKGAAYIMPLKKNGRRSLKAIELPLGCTLHRNKGNNSMTLELTKTNDADPWIICPRKYLSKALTEGKQVSFITYKDESLALVSTKGKKPLNEKGLFSFLRRFQKRRAEIHKKLKVLIVDTKADQKGNIQNHPEEVVLESLPGYEGELNELCKSATELTILAFGLRPLGQMVSLGEGKLTLFGTNHFLQEGGAPERKKKALWITHVDECISCPHSIEEMRYDAQEALTKGHFFKEREFKKTGETVTGFKKEKPENIFLLKQRILRDGGVESICERVYPYGFINKMSQRVDGYLGKLECKEWVKAHFSCGGTKEAGSRERSIQNPKASPTNSVKGGKR